MGVGGSLSVKNKFEGHSILGQVLNLQLMESLVGNSHLAISNKGTGPSDLLHEFLRGLVHLSLELGTEDILLGLELKVKLASRSEVKVDLEHTLGSIKVNISESVVFLASNINDNIDLLVGLIILSLKGVGLFSLEFSLQETIVVKVNKPGVVHGGLLEVIVVEFTISP